MIPYPQPREPRPRKVARLKQFSKSNHSDRNLVRWQNRHLGTNLPVPPVKKKRDNPEHRAQRALIDWWHHACKGLGIPERLLYACPNGGWRDPVGAKFLKAEGQRNGAPDLILDVARGAWHGLRIEMKTPAGVTSDDQRAFHADLVAQGYAVRVCYSVSSAMDVITKYLAGLEFYDQTIR